MALQKIVILMLHRANNTSLTLKTENFKIVFGKCLRIYLKSKSSLLDFISCAVASSENQVVRLNFYIQISFKWSPLKYFVHLFPFMITGAQAIKFKSRTW